MSEPRPWLDDGDVRLYHGDCLEVLRQLPDSSVHMCATSPPFYGLRDYGVDGQIGLEETPDQWVDRLVQVFREVRRVLRDDGTLWVEIGDSYAANRTYQVKQSIAPQDYGESNATRVPEGMKPKDMMGQPWALAFALRADGWYLRSEIIWARPNAMPESVTDRPTKSHSTIFLLSKNARYYFDSDAIREPHKYDGRRITHVQQGDGSIQHRNGERWPGSGANARSVWWQATEPTPYAHFATWPQALVRRMILAGTSEKGCCPECGAPWVRDVERTPMVIDRSERTHSMGQTRSSGTVLEHPTSKTVGWSPTCRCSRSPASADGMGEPPAGGTACRDTLKSAQKPVPCIVLDPFAGSATTMLVARNHGRHAVGIELNDQYLEIAAKRLQQLSLLTGTEA